MLCMSGKCLGQTAAIKLQGMNNVHREVVTPMLLSYKVCTVHSVTEVLPNV